MPKPNRIILPASVLLMVALACTLPGMSVPNPNALGTSIAQTVIAGLTLQPSVLPPVQDSPMPVFTFTSIVAPPTLTSSSTPTAIMTATMTATLTLSPTSDVPMISVSVPTNCRTGPGKVYDRVGALMDGVKVKVFARNPSGEYWYIRNPNRNNQFCWVWGEYATLYGNYISLPVYTPMPTPTVTKTSTPTRTPVPTPAFTATYTSTDACKKNRWVEFRLKNTGGVSFKSIGITVKDIVTDITVSSLTNGFANKNGCNFPLIRDVLAPDKLVIVSASPFTYNPNGHRLRATITLCSKTGQNGTCVTETVVFTP